MASKAEEIDVDGVAVRLTNRDKPYFPKLGSKGTKGALFDYYLSVADRMVNLLRDRPVHLQRFPDGIEGEEIYQKRVPQKHPDYLETCLITFPSGRTADALKVTHPSAIAWAAQWHRHPAPVAGALPGHRAPRRAAHRLRPSARHGIRRGADHRRRRAQAAARRARHGRLSEDLRRPGRARLSAGRHGLGFHRGPSGRDRVGPRDRRRAPDAVTTSWWKEERGERVFIDYNQNARDRTFASAYSARKTPIATVSTPLTWAELADADPDDFTIETVPDFLAGRDDPWAASTRMRSRSTAAGHGQSRRGAGSRRSAVSAELPEDAGRATPRATQKKVAANWDEEGNPVKTD